MAGSSCLDCIFAQWDGQNQKDCALKRLDKYENVNILNSDRNGFYKVLPYNVCAGHRNKSWLSENPRNPVSVVRSELYPKLQLIVLIDKVSETWINFFLSNKFEKYSAVDVLVFEPEKDFVKDIGFAFNYANFFIHACFPVEKSICSAKQHHINNFVRKDCQFYVLADDPANTDVSIWPDRLDNFINEECNGILMAAEDKPYDNLLVYTPLHFFLGGYGSQSIGDKICIHVVNHRQINLVRHAHEVLESGSDEVAVYNTEEEIDESTATT